MRYDFLHHSRHSQSVYNRIGLWLEVRGLGSWIDAKKERAERKRWAALAAAYAAAPKSRRLVFVETRMERDAKRRAVLVAEHTAKRQRAAGEGSSSDPA